MPVDQASINMVIHVYLVQVVCSKIAQVMQVLAVCFALQERQLWVKEKIIVSVGCLVELNSDLVVCFCFLFRGGGGGEVKAKTENSAVSQQIFVHTVLSQHASKSVHFLNVFYKAHSEVNIWHPQVSG